MNQAHAELWKRIRAFSLDAPGSDLTFTRRLAQENGWDAAYARRAAEEYKKFMFLAVAAGHPVSPSDQVDQVWHLHMTYTHSYWENFCRETLGKPLHHEPTRGGRQEGRKFAAWYEKTLGSYRAFFGEEPPPDLWPGPRARFSQDTRFERVNRERSIILSKTVVGATTALFAAAAGVVLLLLFGERVASALRSAMDLRGPEFLGFYLWVFGAVMVGGLLFRWSQRKPGDGPTAEEQDLDAYEVAYLAGGAARSADAAIASLVGRGALALMVTQHRIKGVRAVEEHAHPLERALFGAANVPGGADIPTLRRAAEPALGRIRSRLEALGLVVSDDQNLFARGIGIVAVLATMIFGVAKVCVGVERHRAVGLLIALVVASGVAGMVILGRRLLRSRRGDRVLDRVRHEYHGLEQKAARAAAGLTSLEVPMAAGLFGLTVLSGNHFDALRLTLKPPSATSAEGGGGCGGGDGGGGGGCGGCGGCGS